MSQKQHQQTPKGASFTELILQIMKVRGLLDDHGQRLTRPHGLTVARWPVLGAIETAPLTASQISRRMGVSRQNVRTVVAALKKDGLVTLQDNPDHARAPLVEITPKAIKMLKSLHTDQRAWANEIGDKLTQKEMVACLQTLQKLETLLDEKISD